jgi:hypothetical protein
MWDELVNLVSIVEMSDEDDALIWQFQSNGIYSSRSLYSVINFKGVTLVFVSVVWKLKVPLESISFSGYSLKTRS